MSNYVRCSRCGKRVSNVACTDLIVRAFVECPECIEAAANPEPNPRWEGTSFADTTEAAIHHALIDFTLALDERRAGRGDTWPDESDLYIGTRRLVRDLATGEVDAEEWLTEFEERQR